MANPGTARGKTTIDLERKVAIVTGASRGIGEAIARTFADHGAKVVLASRKIEGLKAVEASINEAHPGAALAIAAHTGKEEDCVRLVKEAGLRFGKVDVLVNNAATNPHFGPLCEIENPAWDKTFEVNLKGYFWMTREVVRQVQARGGDGGAAIVNIASVAGLMASPAQGAYAMTKAAVISMTKTLAVELASSHVRVNAIAPGFVDTRLASAIIQNEGLLAMIKERTPMRRYGVPGEIAGGALYLASDAASFLTGHTLVIDGGMTAS
jgi:NAD(P)-dependent dehydrogenase (short-subunit alcohol dehydrogenase family)